VRRAFLIAVVSVAAGTLDPAMAHEGHQHKVMGKVLAIDQERIEVETTDGKKVKGLLRPDTKYRRDTAPAARGDVKVGERVVLVVVQEQEEQNVKEVLLGASGTKEHED
jgi:hypothetical protein